MAVAVCVSIFSFSLANAPPPPGLVGLLLPSMLPPEQFSQQQDALSHGSASVCALRDDVRVNEKTSVHLWLVFECLFDRNSKQQSKSVSPKTERKSFRLRDSSVQYPATNWRPRETTTPQRSHPVTWRAGRWAAGQQWLQRLPQKLPQRLLVANDHHAKAEAGHAETRFR